MRSTAFVAFATIGISLCSLGIAQETSNNNQSHRPEWSVHPAPEVNPRDSGISVTVQQARELRFNNFFLPNIDDPKNAHYGSRTYVFASATSLMPTEENDLILIATPTQAQPYLAFNRSAVYTDLRSRINTIVVNKKNLPLGDVFSILYPGGYLATNKGTTVRREISSGTTPLDLAHKYFLFLHYDQPTDSFTILRAWDVSQGVPKALSRNGTISRSAVDPEIVTDNDLTRRVEQALPALSGKQGR